MKPSVFPSWIGPGNAFRLIVRVAKYVANLEYGMLQMSDQEYDWWADSSSGYSLDQFHDELASKVIWERSQEIVVWGLDIEIGTECKLVSNEEFGQWMNSMWDEKLVEFGVEVVYKKGYEPIEGTTNLVELIAQGTSSVITANPIDQATAQVISVVDQVFEAMGFKAIDERAKAAATAMEITTIPVIPTEIQQDMLDAAIVVDDEVPINVLGWDRDNPDMSVGTFYPSMDEFRMEVKQYAIVHEFELETEKSDKDKFRGKCNAMGCPWIIRAKT
uniref:Transposase MuDR plant domain-containing protein n=1 Tax=Oryza punctata TaxID=4537 RepID=A0A0E0LKI9_ORYPU